MKNYYQIDAIISLTQFRKYHTAWMTIYM